MRFALPDFDPIEPKTGLFVLFERAVLDAVESEKIREARSWSYVEGATPACVEGWLETGLLEHGTRNAVQVQLVLMLKSLGRSASKVEQELHDWATEKVAPRSNSSKSSRLRALQFTVAWAFRRETSGNCALMRAVGGRCPGEAACGAVRRFEEKPGATSEVDLDQALEPAWRDQDLRFKAIPVATDRIPQHVPCELTVACKPADAEPCTSCKYRKKEGGRVELSSERILFLANTPTIMSWGKLYRDWAGLPDGCPTGKVFPSRQQTMTLVLVQPPRNGVVKSRENVVYVLGHHKVEELAEYEFTARTLTHPRTYKAVHVATRASRREGPPDGAALPEEREKAVLELFRPDSLDNAGIGRKLNSILLDWEQHVHRIFGRPLHSLLLALPWFSPIGMRFDDREERALLKVLAFGDTGQGKSEMARRFRDFFGCGEIVSGENLSLAGLLAGVTRVDGREIPRQGVLARCDKSLLVIDEWGAVPDEIKGALSQARSDLRVTMHKIASVDVQARTREILLANPMMGGRDCAMRDVPYGVQHVVPLMRDLADTRRMDYVVGFSESAEIREAINAQRELSIEHRYVGETARDLVSWIWTRLPGQVVFERDAALGAKALAADMTGSSGYSSTIPLLAPGDARLKIARLAVAVAGLTASMEEHRTLLVREAHVAFAGDLLHKLYDGTELQFDAFSRDDPRHCVLDHAVIQAFAIRLVATGAESSALDGSWSRAHWYETAKLLLQNQGRLSASDLGDLTATPVETRKRILSLFAQEGVLEKRASGLKLTLRGVQMLKVLRAWYEEKKRPVTEVTPEWVAERLGR